MSFRSAEERSDHKERAAATAAFEDLFLQNWEKVYGVLFRLTGDHAEAEDLALETFLRLWQRPPAQEQALAGWLYRVATNLGYNALRSAGRRSRHELDAGMEALATGAASPNPRPGTCAPRQTRKHRHLGRSKANLWSLHSSRPSDHAWRIRSCEIGRASCRERVCPKV